MRRAYFDTSALIKLTHAEPCSLALIDYLDEADIQVSTSVVAEIEALRAFQRINVDATDAFKGFYLLALDNDVRREAVRVGSVHLRALDAIHVATAVAIGDRELEFVTYDDRQAEAARLAGLTVVQPGR